MTRTEKKGIAPLMLGILGIVIVLVVLIVLTTGVLWNMGTIRGADAGNVKNKDEIINRECLESIRVVKGSDMSLYIDEVIVHANGQVDIHAKNAVDEEVLVRTSPGPDSDGDGVPDSYGSVTKLSPREDNTIDNVYNARYGGLDPDSVRPGDCYSVRILVSYEVGGREHTVTLTASGTIVE